MLSYTVPPTRTIQSLSVFTWMKLKIKLYTIKQKDQ